MVFWRARSNLSANLMGLKFFRNTALAQTDEIMCGELVEH